MKKFKSLYIKNITVYDIKGKKKSPQNIYIENGIVSDMGKNTYPNADIVIDGEDCLLLPGLIDIHEHLREPGEEHKETIASGALAALAGGFTDIYAMPNTKPPIDTPEKVKFNLMKAKEVAYNNVHVIGSITKGQRGESLAELGLMAKYGTTVFSDDGKWVSNARIMRYALEYTKMFNGLIISHAEDLSLTGNGQIHEGEISTLLGLSGIPEVSETCAIARDIDLARFTKAKLHITHISTEQGLKMIKQAKLDGLKISVDVTPHHIFFTDENLTNFDTNLKVKPPIRSRRDRDSIIRAIKNGLVDAIATDHAPHSKEEKELEFVEAPFGIIGNQIAFPILYKRLVVPGIITLKQLLKLLTSNPANIVQLKNKNKGSIKKGIEADLFIFNPNEKWTFSKETSFSLSENSPFFNKSIDGKIKYVILKNQLHIF